MIETKKVRNKVQVKFILPEDESLGKVSVVGDFNAWNPSATPFAADKDHRLNATIQVKAGEKYAYRYLSEGRGWFNEDIATNCEPSPFGSFNSVLLT